MKRFIFSILIAGLVFSSAKMISAQVSINTDGSAPHASAMLDVKSTTRGLLIPRMTETEILAILNPANGLQVFCTTDSKLYIYVSMVSQWKEIPYGEGALGQPFPCNYPITIYHIAGLVAPVTKATTYGTVTGIPGEPSKCWITSNLGSDHQATAVDDATEPSAGWYWQFNRKQGYKHDGSTRTPNTTWMSFISEGSGWIAANDPCNIELGGVWRIPTHTEWENVDFYGGWTTWTGPWGSGLKLHAAGYLHPSDGSLRSRGSQGYYWARGSPDNAVGFIFHFNSAESSLNGSNKSTGASLRCIRDL